MNFWQNIKKAKDETGQPFFCLAPMADVTDPAFRQIIAKYGKPDVLWTEFVSADGLCHPLGREKLLKDLEYSEGERPIVAQLFSSNPDNMRSACKLCAELGFDGIDINMGCPDKTIEKQGCGSAMIKTPELAIEIIKSARAGIADAGKGPAEGRAGIPLSVKTRVGYSHDEIDTWIKLLLEQNLDALTVHARTRKDLSKVPANWNYITRVVKLRNEIAPHTVIIGNGDIADMQDGEAKAQETGCDGIMIGRAVFGNPWIFSNSVGAKRPYGIENPSEANAKVSLFGKILTLVGLRKKSDYQNAKEDEYMTKKRYWLFSQPDIPLSQKLAVMIEHTELFEKLLGQTKNFAVIKKHYKAYATGFPGAKELRIKLMETKNVDEAKQIVNNFLKNL